MKFDIVKKIAELLKQAKQEGISLGLDGEEPLKFDQGSPKSALQKQVSETFNDMVSDLSLTQGMSRRDFLKTPLALSVAALAVSAGIGGILYPRRAEAAPTIYPAPYNFLAFGSPLIPEATPSAPLLPNSAVQGKVALIIGGSKGMGKELASRLHAKGFRVIATSRTPWKYPPPPYPLWQLDLTIPLSIAAFVAKVKKNVSKVNLVHANAGRFFLGRPLQSSRAQMRFLMETNVDGHITLIQNLLPLMADGNSDYSRILFQSSTSNHAYSKPVTPDGFSFFALLSPYAESKARLTRFAGAILADQRNVGTPTGNLLAYPPAKKIQIGVIHPVLVNTQGLVDNTIFGEDKNLPHMQAAYQYFINSGGFGGLDPVTQAGPALEEMAMLVEPYPHVILADPTMQLDPMNPFNPAPGSEGAKALIQIATFTAMALEQADAYIPLA